MSIFEKRIKMKTIELNIPDTFDLMPEKQKCYWHHVYMRREN